MKRLSSILVLITGLLVSACLADLNAPKNEPSKPTVSYDVESLTRVSVKLEGFSSSHNPGIVEYGFDLAEGSFGEGKTTTIIAKKEEGDYFTATATIQPGNHYVVRSWFSNKRQKKYSQEKAVSAPSVSAATLTDVTYAEGHLRAAVVDDGGRVINEVGFCWGRTDDIREVKRGNMRQATLIGNEFTLDVSEFKIGETYYLLAYAENSDKATADIYGYSRNLMALTVYDDYVEIEDANFEAYLIANFDTNHDGRMSYREMAAITEIDIATDNIFTVKEIDLMPKLKRLRVQGSAFQSGRLIKLDVCKNNELTTLICDNNQLDSLIISACPLLDTLSCVGNRISTLDVKSGRNLRCLRVGNNPLDQVIDISDCELLTEFSAENCSTLETIYVWLNFREEDYPNFQKDVKGAFIIAPHIIIPIPDAEFKIYLIENYDLNEDGEINVEEGLQITHIVVSTYKIASISGIEYFMNLVSLDCDGQRESSMISGGGPNIGRLKTIDVSKNRRLAVLNCSHNLLKSLDVSKNTELIQLSCDHNWLTEMDVSCNNKLQELSCANNYLTVLDICRSKKLKSLKCDSNPLTSLNVSENTELIQLSCGNNQLTTLDVSKNTALTYLSCSSNKLTSLDVSRNTALRSLFCDSNQLTSLDVSKNTALTDLSCSSNKLTSLDVSRNTALRSLFCDSNQLTSLDVSKNMALTYLFCQSNQWLTNIWFGEGQVINNFSYDASIATIKYKE